jgi:hypothetical protein
MQQGHSLEVDNKLVDKFAAFKRSGRFITAVLNHVYPVLILKHFSKIHFNIFFPSRCTYRSFDVAKKIHFHVYDQDLV